MKKLMNGGLIAITCLLWLSGCGTSDDAGDANTSGLVVEDEALRSAAIDFIALRFQQKQKAFWLAKLNGSRNILKEEF